MSTESQRTEGAHKTNIALWVVAGVMLLAAMLAGLQWWRVQQENISLQKELTTSNAQLSSLLQQAGSQTEGNKNDPYAAPVLSEKDKAGLALSAYVCAMKDFGCDKVQKSITKIQVPTGGAAGFAVGSTSVNSAKFYLKSVNGQWIVIYYDDQTTVPQDIIDHFGIPQIMLQ